MRAVVDTGVLISARISDEGDLLVLGKVRGVQIVTARAFAELVG